MHAFSLIYAHTKEVLSQSRLINTKQSVCIVFLYKYIKIFQQLCSLVSINRKQNHAVVLGECVRGHNQGWGHFLLSGPSWDPQTHPLDWHHWCVCELEVSWADITLADKGKLYWTKKLTQHVKCWSRVSWAEMKDPWNVLYAQTYFSQMLWNQFLTPQLVSISALLR